MGDGEEPLQAELRALNNRDAAVKSSDHFSILRVSSQSTGIPFMNVYTANHALCPQG